LKARKNFPVPDLKSPSRKGPYVYPMALRPSPPSALAPEYLPAQPFSKLQNIGLTFSWNPKGWSLMTEILNSPARFKIECASTLTQEKGSWFTRLSEAKFSLK
jgi:hypothetical protein